MNDPAFPDALPAQYRLHWYVLDRVLGQGGFGITYLARDTNLDQAVAIKEYLPIDVATRRADGTVRSRTDDQQERYRWGLDRFIQEARTLARFDHPNIVRALSVFEHNNTAYMVMRFEEGENFGTLLERRRTLPEAEIRAVLLPILDGLALVHGAGFIHRDIKPENIHIRSDGTPVLLDFGSARSALGNSRTVTILVAPGYAPFEQYYANGGNQGPWTDIYGLGATCYRAIAGVPPMDAIGRSKGVLGSTREILEPACNIGAGRYSERFLKAIDHALEFAEKDRPQSIVEWRAELLGEYALVGAERAAVPVRPSGASAASVFRGPIAWAALGALVAIGAAALWLPAKSERERLTMLEAELANIKKAAAAPASPAAPEKPPPAAAPPVAADAASAASPPVETPVAVAAPPVPVPAPPKPQIEQRKAEPRPAPKPSAPIGTAPSQGRPGAPARPVQPAPEASAPGAAQPVAAPAPPVVAPAPPAVGAPAVAVAVPPVQAPVAPAEPKGPDPRQQAPEQPRPPADPKAAFEYWQKRAGQGNAEALFRLGEMYATGAGGNRVSNKDAYIRFALAARAGYAGARARQQEIAPKLQAEEIRAADDFIDKIGRARQ